MKNSTMAWILVAGLFTTSVLFACLYLSERHSLQRTQTALDMTEKSEAELRGNVQAAMAQSDKQESKAAAQDKVNAVCGIYSFDNSHTQANEKLDIRSDGMVFYSIRDGVWPAEKMAWALDGDTVNIQGVDIRGNENHLKFQIEQNDLIDSDGNRWLHIR